MTERLTSRDWILISAYLDARLSPAALTRVEKRIQEDAHFKRSLEEVARLKQLLAALPQKRAPRNFTLAPEKAQKPLRGLWLQPALSFVSITASILLVLVFSFNYLGMGLARQAAAPRAEIAAMEGAAEEAPAPMIINWNPSGGLGGGAAEAKSPYTGIDGIGGPGIPVAEPGIGGGAVEPAVPELPPGVDPQTAISEEPEPAAFEEPAPAALESEPVSDADLSNLILGLAEDDTAGQVIESAPLRKAPAPQPRRGFSAPSLVMLIAGITALLSGAGALFLRKKFHA